MLGMLLMTKEASPCIGGNEYERGYISDAKVVSVKAGITAFFIPTSKKVLLVTQRYNVEFSWKEVKSYV